MSEIIKNQKIIKISFSQPIYKQDFLVGLPPQYWPELSVNKKEGKLKKLLLKVFKF